MVNTMTLIHAISTLLIIVDQDMGSMNNHMKHPVMITIILDVMYKAMDLDINMIMMYPLSSIPHPFRQSLDSDRDKMYMGMEPRCQQSHDVSPVQHSSPHYVEYGGFRQHSSNCDVSTRHVSPSHPPVVKKELTTPPRPTRVVNIKKEPPDVIEIMSMDEEAATPVKKATSVKKEVSDKPKLFPLFSKGYKPPIVEKSSDEDDGLIPVLLRKKQLADFYDYQGTVMHDGKANCAIFSVKRR